MPAIQPILETLEQIYCENCHLATPTWRKRCIHCSKELSFKSKHPAKPANTGSVNIREQARRYTARFAGRNAGNGTSASHHA